MIMRCLRRFLAWAGGIRGGSRVRGEFQEELRFHLEMETRANLEAGMSPAEARRRARLAFGSQEWHAERVREEGGGARLEDLARDLRFGFRNLLIRPVFAGAAILTLSLGIGMTTTMFTLVDAVLLRPLPGSNAGGLVYLELQSQDGEMSTSPTPELLRLVRDHADAFSRVEAYTLEDFTFRVDGEPLRGKGARASVGFFSFLGVAPALGRGFLPEDGLGGGAPVVVLGHTLWASRFGGRRDVLDRTVEVGGVTHRIVGVLPGDFRVDTPSEALFWIPEGAAGALFAEGVPVEGALARLAEGVTLEAARAQLDAIVRNNPLQRLARMEWVGKVHTPADLINPDLKRAILVLQAGALLVLLIGCGNLANLLLAQGEARSREMALRASLGAGKGRLVRQLLAESAVLGFFGCLGGIGLAVWAMDSLSLFLPAGFGGVGLNGLVLLFAACVSLLAVVGTGLLPALVGSGRDLAEVLKGGKGVTGGPRGPMRLRHLLVAGEVAMAFVLLVSAALLLKSFAGLTAGDVGFDRRDLLTLRLEFPEDAYGDNGARRAFRSDLWNRIREGFPASLGSVTLAGGLVEDLAAAFSSIGLEGEEAAEGERSLMITWGVAPGYFEVLGLPLLQGRGFTEEDRDGGEAVTVINQRVEGRYFPEGDAVGRRIRLGEDWFRVVGVAGSVDLPALAQGRFGDLQFFFPLDQRPEGTLSVIARVPGDRAAAVALLKEAVWAVDPALPIVDVALVTDQLAESLAQERSNTLLMGLFAFTALMLGAVGLYGVVAYSVSRRIREMGVRLALGASAGSVVAGVVLGGMRWVAGGLLLGLVAAVALGSTLAELLYRVSPRDPAVLAVAGMITLAVALLATWIPARRAAGAGPLDALRAE